MTKNRLFNGLGLATVVVAGAFFLSSCSNKITDEQLQKLKELRMQEKNLSESVQLKKDEKSRLERELNARKAELKKCNDEKAFVQSKLANWPNVWPQLKEENK